MELSKQYIAGLFDGEGHVSITWSERRGQKCPKLCVKITNTYLPVLLSMKELYGGSIYSNKKQKESYLRCFVLSLTVEQSKVFLIDLLPYLVIKRKQAEIALKFAETVYRRGKKPITDAEKKIRECCMDEIRKEKNVEFQWIQHRQLINGHTCWRFDNGIHS